MWETQIAVIYGQLEEAKNTLSRCPKSQFVKAGKMPGQKALYYRLTFLEWQMKELLEKMKEDPHQKWDNALRETEVRIKEVQDWLDIQESENEDWGKMVVGDDGRRRPEMPTFGSKEQVRDALTNKHLGMPHEDGTRSDEAEVKRQREGVHKREAERALEKMDGKNPYGK